MKNCILCGKALGKEEACLCKTCLGFLRYKYKDKKMLREVIKCHKEYAKIRQE
jgi:hypothetical protein